MQKFTKTEISWIAVEFDKLARQYGKDADEASDRKLAKMCQMRADQYTDISRRMKLALKEGSKRIEIK